LDGKFIGVKKNTTGGGLVGREEKTPFLGRGKKKKKNTKKLERGFPKTGKGS